MFPVIQRFKGVCLILAIGVLIVSCFGIGGPENRDLDNAGTAGTVGEVFEETANTEEESSELGSRQWVLSQSFQFQMIEAGSFTMGSPANEVGRDSDENQVQVQITRPFEIMTTEVTQSQWFGIMGYNPSRFKSQKYCDDHDFVKDMCPNHPVVQVSWKKVQEFIRKLNGVLGLTGCDGTPSSSVGCYRLPTEAEWEYSARAGTKTAYSFGNDPQDLGDYAWYRGNSKRKTHKVGSKKANPWGLYDVHGNVWEWVQDSYIKILPGGTDPLNTAGSLRVIRGGAYNFRAPHLRSANRNYDFPFLGRYSLVGFRLVRTL